MSSMSPQVSWKPGPNSAQVCPTAQSELELHGSGGLFASAGSLGYLLMVGFSAVALGLSLLLARLWNGGQLPVRRQAVDEARSVA